MKLVYVGPTIIGVAARNTVYDCIPAQLQEAIRAHPFLQNLIVPISEMPEAMKQIREKRGAAYSMYKKALAISAK